MQERSKESVRAYRTGAGLLVLFVCAFIGSYLGGFGMGNARYEGAIVPIATTTPEAPVRRATHVPAPQAARGIYMTSCVASVPSLRSNLEKLISETELNAIVVDIKTFDGYLSFAPKDPVLQKSVGGCYVKDMQDFIDELHSKGIYVIGRLASFQDQLMVKLRPDLAVKKATATSTIWRDYKGIAWIDASAKDHWEYLVKIAKEAHDIGFDEINFDYIRYPADGNMRDIYFPISGKKLKSEVVRSFYEFVHDSLLPLGITTSGDVFGMTTTNTDDLNIGQILEYALANFDYVMPMVYPSHYPPSFMNLGDPNKHVYEVVNISMREAAKRALSTTTSIFIEGGRIGTTTPAFYAKPSYDVKKLRPWLQDNNYPVPYTAEMVKDQIRAAYDAGLDSWFLWNAGNRYTKAALEAEIR